MNLRDHLTDDQVQLHLKKGQGAWARSGRIEKHLADCGPCRTRVLHAERAESGLPETRAWHAEVFSDCPSVEALQDFAAGVCSEESAEPVMSHVVRCLHCAPLLRAYLQAVEESEKKEEEIKSQVGAGWLTRIKQWIPAVGLRPAMASLAMVVTTLVGVETGPPLLNAYNLSRTEKQIEAAFRDNGSVDMRLSWSPYPKDGLRRDDKKPPSSADSSTLAAASQHVADRQNSSDPRWIRLRGRVKLLLREDAEAAKLLDAAAEQQMNDPDTLIDQAVAHFEKDMRVDLQDPAAKTRPNVGESLELLTKVLRDPRLNREQRAVALFDLAVVYEKMLMWDDAVHTWEKYLDLDQTSQWRGQAQRDLENARKKVQGPRPQGYRQPSFFLQRFGDPDVQQSLEEYQDIALRKWLAASVNDPNSEAFLAARKLGELMEERHGDSWMNDFLNAVRPGQSETLQMLGDAVTYNKQGRYSEAERKASGAAAYFAGHNNGPGAGRAMFEVLYARQRVLEEKTCLNLALVLDKKLQSTRYRWLQTQTALERAICLNNTGVSAAREQLEAGRQTAKKAGFRILTLRAQALEAGMQVDLNCDDTWSLAQAGLEQYWRGPGAPSRLYEFYSPIKQCLEKQKLWHAAEALERRMIAILEKQIDGSDENLVLEATAHSALGQILKELNDEGAAEDEAKLAIQLLGNVDKVIARRYEIPIRLKLADLQLERGDTEASLNTVREAENDLGPTQNQLMRLNFLRVRGDVYLSRQQWNEAEDDYKQGLEIAEHGFHGFHEDRQRRHWAGETGDLCRGLVEVLLRQKRDQEALQLWEWFQSRAFVSQTAPENQDDEIQWTAIAQSVLSEPLPSTSETRLVYTSARDQLYIWLISGAGIRTVRVPVKREYLQELIRRHLRKCSAPQDPELPLQEPDRESKQLFSLLLQPVIADLRRSETVVVDLDMGMEGLLVEALKSPEGWYFGQEFPVVYSPGYMRERDLRVPLQAAPRSGLLLDALEADDEGKNLIEMFPEITRRDGQDITSPELTSQLDLSEVFVFIGHGKSGELIIRNKKPLRSQDFQPETLRHLRLVVLAACSTGLAPSGPLDTRSLVYAFQSGGTPQVIASRWDVHSTTTTKLMTSFYKHLKGGESAPRALFEARKEIFGAFDPGDLRDSYYHYHHYHPYYWAGFVLNGRA